MIEIVVLTLKEAIRKRIILLIGIASIIYLVIYGLIAHVSFGSGSRNDFHLFLETAIFLSVVGLYFSNMITAFMTIMASVGSVSSEVESGILHSVISRPIKRREYILGKYLGLVILISVYSILLYLSIFLVSMIINIPSVQHIGLQKILSTMLLFILQPIAILSLCLYGSASFKTINNGIFVILIYILGLLGGIIEQIGAFLKNDVLYQWGILSSLISPFDIIYRKMMSILYSDIGLTNPFMPVPFSYMPTTLPSNWMMVYIAAYALLLLFLAIRKFTKKDL